MLETRWAAGRWSLIPRLLVLAGSLASLAYLVLSVGAFGAPEPEFLDAQGLWSFGVSLVVIFALMGLLAIYIVDVLANPRLNDRARVIWGIALAAGNVIAMPIYWLIHLSRPRT